MELFESAQDYLERILMLEESYGEGKVHAIEVANALHFSRPSVSVAMHKLEESGYIQFGPEKELILTQSGREEALKMLERHRILTNYFIAIGVPKEVAANDACKVEHDLSPETFQAMKDDYNNHHKH